MHQGFLLPLASADCFPVDLAARQGGSHTRGPGSDVSPIHQQTAANAPGEEGIDSIIHRVLCCVPAQACCYPSFASSIQKPAPLLFVSIDTRAAARGRRARKVRGMPDTIFSFVEAL